MNCLYYMPITIGIFKIIGSIATQKLQLFFMLFFMFLLFIGLWVYIKKCHNAEHIIKNEQKELSILRESLKSINDIVQDKNKEINALSQQIADQNKFIVNNQENMQLYATIDESTQLPNRFSLKADLRQLLKTHNKNLITGALFFIDFDDFKHINDQYGISFGDDVIKIISLKLRKSFEGYGRVYRFGGDEFAAIVDTAFDKDSIDFLANKIISDFNNPIQIDDNPFVISFSLGISLIPIHGNTYDAIVGSADIAMYTAKNDGKNTYRIYKENSFYESEQLVSIKQELTQAVEEDALQLIYQPVYRKGSKSIALVESTLSWKSSVGFISPLRFMMIAKELGILSEINNNVIKEVCEVSSIITHSKKNILISFNLSMHDLISHSMINDLHKILNDTACDPTWVCFEITELNFDADYSFVLKQINELRKIGFKIIIDDFGSEFLSLNYLKKLSIDYVKIDVNLLLDKSKNISTIGPMMDILKALNIQIIVKNVETPIQELAIQALDFDLVQGFQYAYPLSKQALLQQLLDEEIKIYANPNTKELLL